MNKFILLLCSLFLVGNLFAQNAAAEKQEFPRTDGSLNKTYPFNIQLKTADNKVISSDKVIKAKGKPTVVMFWLTTCGPCKMELEAIQKKYPNWKKEVDFNMVAISTDFQGNFKNFITRVKSSGWQWQAYHDYRREFLEVMPGSLNGLPQVFVYDAKGNISYHKRKYAPGDEDELFNQIKQAGKKK